MAELSLLEQLVFCTTRIEATTLDEKQTSGTGFFYNYQLAGMELPFLITNRHVIENKKSIKFGFSCADENGNPLYQPAIMQAIEVQNFVVYHPDNDVDLCAIPAFLMLALQRKFGKTPFLKAVSDNIIPSLEQRKILEPVEDIILIGYPNGLWDKENNMPLVRRGITATAPFLDFNGKKEFVIDAACFTGSSGSPVFLYNNGAYIEKNNKNVSFGQRCMLLGILSEGPQPAYKGEIVLKSNPKKQADANAIVHIPNNLGYCISSERVLEMKSAIEKNNSLIFNALIDSRNKQ